MKPSILNPMFIASAVLVLACGASVPELHAQDDSDPTNSRITRVVIYPNHAQVTREMAVDLKEGGNTVRFTGLVAILEAESLRATASPGVRITGTETRTVFLKEALTEDIKNLDEKIQRLTDQLDERKRATARWAEQKSFYTAIKARVANELQEELSSGKLSIPDWDRMLDFVRTGMEKCDRETSVIEFEVRDLAKEFEVLKQEREQYVQRGPEVMKEVHVSAGADRSGAAAVRIHYIVPSALWLPMYDVHLDRKSKTVQVIGYGHVVQWTGEPWEKVKLTLAMNRPDFELALPELNPMVVSLNPEDIQQLAKDVTVLSAAPRKKAQEWSKQRFKAEQEREKFRRNLERLARASDDQLQQYGLTRKLVADALSRLVDRFAGVSYDVGQPETIPCDSSPRKVVTFSAQVPVELTSVATPAVGDTVVLKGDIQNTTGHPIVEGHLSLFIDNSYVGASKMTSAAENESISFCFGPDDTLVVDRELANRTVEGPEKFRQSQIITYDYAITAENFGDQAARLAITDQIPIPQTPDIQVKFLKSNRDHALDTKTGLLAWTVEVPPGEKTEITFSFSVECPVGMTVFWK